MSNIDKQGLREAAANAKIAGEAPVMPFDQRIMALNDFMMQCTPAAVMALLDELEARLPPTIWYDCDGESQEIAVLEKRLVEKALSDAGLKIAAAAGKGE